MSDDVIIICAVCRRVLHNYIDETGAEYIHTEQDSPADHEPQPIRAPEGYREGRCDFCNHDWPEFVLPVRDFVPPGRPNEMSLGSWAACPTCGKLIDSNRWSDLVARVVALRELEGNPVSADQRAQIGALYRRLRKNISGSLRPIVEEEQPNG